MGLRKQWETQPTRLKGRYCCKNGTRKSCHLLRYLIHAIGGEVEACRLTKYTPMVIDVNEKVTSQQTQECVQDPTGSQEEAEACLDDIEHNVCIA